MSKPLALRVRRAFAETQTQFATRMGVHPMTVSKWERQAPAPGAETTRRLRVMLREQKATK